MIKFFDFLYLRRLCGSYGALHGGNLCDALVDFTSGLSEMIELKENGYKTDEIAKNKLRKQLLRKHEEHALMCCAISVILDEIIRFCYVNFIEDYS